MEDTETTEAVEPIEDAESTEAVEPVEDTRSTGAVEPVENTETTEAPEPVAPEEVKVTGTVETTEIGEAATDTDRTDSPREIEAEAPRESKEQQEKCSPCVLTPPGSPLRDNSKIENISTEDTTQVETEVKQVVQKIHQSPEVSNSLVTKIFLAFTPAKDTSSQPSPEYRLQI